MKLHITITLFAACLISITESQRNNQRPPRTSTNNTTATAGGRPNNCNVEGEAVEVEGFVMDNFCIDRGTLLDAPDVETLKNPEKHSIHCLVDVDMCVESMYTVLEQTSNGEYAIKYQLGREGTTLAKDAANKARDEGAVAGFKGIFSGVDDGTDELKCVQLLESRTAPSDGSSSNGGSGGTNGGGSNANNNSGAASLKAGLVTAFVTAILSIL